MVVTGVPNHSNNEHPVQAGSKGKQQHEEAPGLSNLIMSMMTPHNLKIGVYLLLWYTLSVSYNLYNKWAIHAIQLPWFVSSCQLFIGIPIICLNWAIGTRKVPDIFDLRLFLKLTMIAVFHCGTHFSAVISMGIGAVSFTHIVKACEPVFTAILTIVFMGTFYAWQVYATLVAVVIGICIASVAELDFKWLALVYALVSAVSASLRGICSKQSLQGLPAEKHLQAQNLYAVLTIISCFLVLVPLFIMEGSQIYPKFQAAENVTTIVWYIVASSLSYFLYNEVAFLALEAVSPVTHAVSSTFKRVFIIGASVLFLKNPINRWGWSGSVIAIVSVLLYSLAKTKYSKPIVSPKSLNSKRADANV